MAPGSALAGFCAKLVHVHGRAWTYLVGEGLLNTWRLQFEIQGDFKTDSRSCHVLCPTGGEPDGEVLRLLCVDTTYPVPSYIRGLLPSDEATVTSVLKDPSAAKAIISWTDAEVSRRCMAGRGATKTLLIQIVINGTQRLPATVSKADLEGWLRVRGISFTKNSRPMTLTQKVVHHLAALADDNENQTTVLNRLKNIISRHKKNPS